MEASDGHWRHVLDDCKTMARWNCISRGYIENLLNKWRFPKSQLPSRERIRFPIEEKVNAMGFAIMGKAKELVWRTGSVLFIVDCQTLADISSGCGPLRNAFYELMCERIVNNIYGTSRCGVFLQNLVRPVELRPRTFNKMAYALKPSHGQRYGCC